MHREGRMKVGEPEGAPMQQVKIDRIWRPLLQIRKKSVLVDWSPAKSSKTMIVAIPKKWAEGYREV